MPSKDRNMEGDVLNLWLKKRGAVDFDRVDLGLVRVRSVREAMGFSLNCSTIVVGGTNGKGSVSAILESILQASGLRVGVYTSPHFQRFNERIKVCGKEAGDSEILQFLEQVESNRKNIVLTYFEYATLAAASFFSNSNLDVVILEIGLGGRLDAVNIFDGDCCILTSLAIDHAEVLGGTIEAIAIEKAGIFRQGRPAVCGIKDPPLALLEMARKVDVDLIQIGRDFDYNSCENANWNFWNNRGLRLTSLPKPSLIGDIQIANAAAALAALDSLRENIHFDREAVNRGLMDINLEGRFQVFSCKPQLILDVCHNPQAVANFRSNLIQLPKSGRTVALFGMLNSKDVVSAIEILKDCVDFWVITELDSDKTLALSDLREAFAINNVSTDRISEGNSVTHAFDMARNLASDDDRILAIGSFYIVSDVKNLMKVKNKW